MNDDDDDVDDNKAYSLISAEVLLYLRALLVQLYLLLYNNSLFDWDAVVTTSWASTMTDLCRGPTARFLKKQELHRNSGSQD